MLRRTLSLGSAIAGMVLLAACSQSPNTMVSPTAAAGDTAANADGSTLKVSAPAPLGPENGSRIDSRRPTVTFANSSGRFTSVALNYRVQLLSSSGATLGESVVAQDPSGQTSLAGETELDYDTDYQWRVRAEYQGDAGPWSPAWSFKTVQRVTIGTSTGSVGSPRNITFGEAYAILYAIYTTARWDLTGRSNRNSAEPVPGNRRVGPALRPSAVESRAGPTPAGASRTAAPAVRSPTTCWPAATPATPGTWSAASAAATPCGRRPTSAPCPSSQQIYAPRPSTLALLP